MPEDGIITEHERKHLLAALQRRLVWVGKEIPYHIDLNGKMCNLHTVVWELLNKEKLDKEDRKFIDKCIVYINKKAKEDEPELATGRLHRKKQKRCLMKLPDFCARSWISGILKMVCPRKRKRVP